MNQPQDERRIPKPRLDLVTATKTADTGAHPFLVSASDGSLYWCKQLKNEHGPQATINEVVCSVIGEAIDAPTVPWEIINVPSDLVGTKTPPSAHGVSVILDSLPVFGSRLLPYADIGDLHTRIQFGKSDGNGDRIPRLIALWLLCNAKDLQVLYDATSDMRIYSVDHGMWFGADESPEWFLAPTSHVHAQTEIAHPDSLIPEDSWTKAIEAVADLREDIVKQILEALPPEWGVPESDVATIARYCLSRRDYTIERLQTEALRNRRLVR